MSCSDQEDYFIISPLNKIHQFFNALIMDFHYVCKIDNLIMQNINKAIENKLK